MTSFAPVVTLVVEGPPVTVMVDVGSPQILGGEGSPVGKKRRGSRFGENRADSARGPVVEHQQSRRGIDSEDGGRRRRRPWPRRHVAEHIRSAAEQHL